MTTQHKNFKNISDGSGNDSLPIYIHYKIPKSRETVHLNQYYNAECSFYLRKLAAAFKGTLLHKNSMH
jgi:hypothetical protein